MSGNIPGGDHTPESIRKIGAADSDEISRSIRIHIEGIVQGVGFRPFLHRLAEKHHIRGWVRNTSSGLEGRLEGQTAALQNFLSELKTSPPPMAAVENVTVIPEKTSEGSEGFSILDSHMNPGSTLISPDISICPACEKELFTPSDRRYRYPFINCTNCGPRYTIIESLPYDRSRTVMKDFRMCAPCRAEYSDIRDRRYHAQPDCCPACGPHAFYAAASAASALRPFGSEPDPDGAETADPFRTAQKLLARGGILAVKGIGGIHLACDGRNADAVKRLRAGKHRAEKPLAVMCRSLESARQICRISEAEARLLTDPARPIVLLSKKEPGSFPELSFSPRLGVMLPYTPLHLLLLDGTYGGPDMVVMTSGNIPGCPVITDNEEALAALSGTADGFLLHNRRIRNRCDDSLVTEWEGLPYFLRRSRGYVPRPVRAAKNSDGIFAMGAEQKASFALGRGRSVFLSPHIGDLKNAETFAHYTESLKTYRDLFRLKPSLYVCDLHPDYLSAQEAARASAEEGVPLIKVQHHWAHMASCMEDNHLDRTCFGIIWDGTGLGTDGTIWGGEFLEGDLEHFTRKGTVRPVRLPGGDRAVREIGRIALSLVRDAGLSDYSRVPLPDEKCALLAGLSDSPLSPAASSIGRLFDGVCALILGRAAADYEGEGAALVEALSPAETPDATGDSLAGLSYPLSFYPKDGVRVFDTRPVIRGILEDLENGLGASRIAVRFMASLCRMALDQCLALNPGKYPVVLSGGVFQNRFLLSGITSLLRENGFTVYTHRRVSTNDEGICLGQLAVARKKRSINHVFSNANED